MPQPHPSRQCVHTLQPQGFWVVPHSMQTGIILLARLMGTDGGLSKMGEGGVPKAVKKMNRQRTREKKRVAREQSVLACCM